MPIFVSFLVFVVLTTETPDNFAGQWHTVMAYGYPFVRKLPDLPCSPLDLVLYAISLLVAFKPSSWRRRVRALDGALLASFAGLVAATAWGAARGGDVRQAYYQTAGLVRLLVLSHVFVAVYKTPHEFQWLARAILFAAIYRASTCVMFFFLFLRNGAVDPYPQDITGHHDSALYVTALLGLTAWVSVSFKALTMLLSGAPMLLLLAAINYNNRRLAWLELAGGLVMLYLAMPVRRLSLRAKVGGALALVLVLLYLGVGWGRSEGVFRPLRRIQSVTDANDASSLSREVENSGLVVTLRRNVLLGSGLGHEYVEVSEAYSRGMRSGFEQYRYIPHNSLLGLVAFTGALLFPLIWSPLAVGAYLAARASLSARTPSERRTTMVSFAVPFVYGVQAFGDMGLQSTTGNLLLAASFAAASRLAIQTGAWAPRRPSRRSTMSPARPEPEGI